MAPSDLQNQSSGADIFLTIQPDPIKRLPVWRKEANHQKSASNPLLQSLISATSAGPCELAGKPGQDNRSSRKSSATSPSRWSRPKNPKRSIQPLGTTLLSVLLLKAAQLVDYPKPLPDQLKYCYPNQPDSDVEANIALSDLLKLDPGRKSFLIIHPLSNQQLPTCRKATKNSSSTNNPVLQLPYLSTSAYPCGQTALTNSNRNRDRSTLTSALLRRLGSNYPKQSRQPLGTNRLTILQWQ
jgi:hypothetical protein